MDIVDPAIDLMEFIALLAGVCGICFTVVIPLTKKINEVTYRQNLDKTVSSLQGEKPSIIEDGCYTAQEIANTVASQSPYLVNPMSVPKIEDLYVYTYCDSELDALPSSAKPVTFVLGDEEVVLTGLAQYDPSTSSTIYTMLQKWCADNGKDFKTTRFKIMFSMGDDSSVMDNVYQLYYLDEHGNLVEC